MFYWHHEIDNLDIAISYVLLMHDRELFDFFLSPSLRDPLPSLQQSANNCNSLWYSPTLCPLYYQYYVMSCVYHYQRDLVNISPATAKTSAHAKVAFMFNEILFRHLLSHCQKELDLAISGKI